MAEGARLESVYTATYREFESLTHRHIQEKDVLGRLFFRLEIIKINELCPKVSSVVLHHPRFRCSLDSIKILLSIELHTLRTSLYA